MRIWVLHTILFLSGLGVFLAVSAFVTFFIFYHNLVAGTWAILSGVFSAICFHLHYLYWRNTLCDYHSANTLVTLSHLGLGVTVISAAFCIWYIFAEFYWDHSMTPLVERSLIAGVWSFMTGKWSLHLFLSSNTYARRLSTPFVPTLARGTSTTSSVSF